MFKSRCYNGGVKHKLEACYQEIPRNMENGMKLRGFDSSDLKDILLYKRYLGHICKWCGWTVRDNVSEENNG